MQSGLVIKMTANTGGIMSTKSQQSLLIYALPFGSLCVVLSIIMAIEVAGGWTALALIWSLALLAVLAVIGLAAEWFPSSADDEAYARGEIVFCEGYETGWIKQPVAVWTDLAFMAAGLAVILVAGARNTAGLNPMADPESAIPLLYGLIVIFMGPASMAFHASMKDWGGWFDNMSIVIWAAFSLSYTLARIGVAAWDWNMWPLFVLAPVIIGFWGWYTAVNTNSRRMSQIITAGAWVLIELITMIVIWTGNAGGFDRSTGWFIATLVAFAFAFASWIPSGAVTEWWCDHDSVWQGHGFWHIFAGVGTLFVYFYLASEVL